MKMNWVEKSMMNNPIRAWFLRNVEGAALLELGGRIEGGRALEVGCGSGVGTEIIFEKFGAAKVVAFDLDETMVEKARKRLRAYPQDRLKLTVGDVTAIDEPDESFDAVFNFAILHHVPDWQAAVAEIRRVLKPGGLFFFEDVTTHALNKWSYRTFMLHPEENRFSADEFVAEIERQGMVVGDRRLEKGDGDFIFGVATRT